MKTNCLLIQIAFPYTGGAHSADDDPLVGDNSMFVFRCCQRREHRARAESKRTQHALIIFARTPGHA